MGEEICAFIKLGDGEDGAVQEIRDHCRGKVRLERLTTSACRTCSLAAALLLLDR